MKVRIVLGLVFVVSCAFVPAVGLSAVFETDDGAFIYYEVSGKGQPILFVPGWTMTTKLWKKQVQALSKDHQVITMDFRGHGNSSKTLSNHTIPRYAKDVRALIDHLKLDKVVLVGWSLGGPVLFSYWEQFGPEKIKALGFVDTAPSASPSVSSGSHGAGNIEFDKMNETLMALASARRDMAFGFISGCFKEGNASKKDVEWILSEHLKTPTAIATAIFSDYFYRDFTDTLKKITVPTIVFSGSSPLSKDSVKVGQWMSSQIPKATFVPFEKGGHMLFYEQPDKFNAALATFIKGID